MSTTERTERVGDYVVGDELGVGGMGRVFTAAHPNGGSVAVKLLHPALVADSSIAGRLHDEARLARLVLHRNVVRVIDSGTTRDGIPFLAMRRAPGVSLGAAIQAQGPLSLLRVRRIAEQMLDGLSAIHAAGLVHGDLKSDNVLVDDDDHVTIIDFGLARPVATTPSWLGENTLSGTPEYMAPEVIRGEVMTHAADLYAAGIIVYEMLTATTPFAGATTAEVFERHLSEAVVPPSLRCADRTLPVALESLVMRALAKDPAQRHHSAALFGTALARAIPASWIDKPSSAGSSAHSTTASTRAWERAPLRPPRRFAEGTRSNESLAVKTKRSKLEACLAAGNADEAIEACFGLAQTLIEEHRLAAAADELSTAGRWIAETSPDAPRRWCLLVTLGAIYDGLGNFARAQQTAATALLAAQACRDDKGVAASRRLMRKLGTHGRRRP